MEFWVIGLLVLVAIGVVGWIVSLFSGGDDENAHSSPQRTTKDKSEGSRWEELNIEWKHPGADWVYLPKFDKDNECKLVSITDMGHREAVKPLTERVVAGKEYSLALKREPTNKYDPNAIQVVDTTNQNADVVGYLPKDVSATIAERYDTEMPITVMVKRAIKSPDNVVYLRLAPLVPKKSLRKKYEPS